MRGRGHAAGAEVARVGNHWLQEIVSTPKVGLPLTPAPLPRERGGHRSCWKGCTLTRNPDIHHARRLRREANTPEQVAWDALRKLRPLGFPVRRQHPIGGYFVDFAIIKARLVVEIDGSIHGREATRVLDARRQADIERLGWRVLRIDARDATSRDHVFAVVSEALGL